MGRLLREQECLETVWVKQGPEMLARSGGDTSLFDRGHEVVL